MKNKIPTKEDLGHSLRDSYIRWEYLSKNGVSDPYWSDGVNMNLVRNHIIYYKKQCEEYLNGDYPPEYYLLLPIIVDKDFMATDRKIVQKEINTDKQENTNPVQKSSDLHEGQLSIFDFI